MAPHPAAASETTTGPRVSRSQAFFGLHFDLHPGADDTALGRDTTPENIASLLDRVKPDFVQYDCKGHSGFTGYPTKVGTSSPGIVKDALAIWRSETRKRGMGLYIHYSGVWDTIALQNHPEWACIGADGKPDKDITSNFGPYTRDLMIPQLKEVVALHDLDGVWADGECWAAKWDYSPAALEAWKKETGLTTAPTTATEPQWKRWKAFHRQAFENHVAEWVDALHAFRPTLELCSNWAYTPHMPLPVNTKVDFLSGDYSPKYSVDRARFEARYLDSTGMPWDLMAWAFNGLKNWSGSPPQKKPALQLMQEAGAVLAQGGGMQVYYQPLRSGTVTDYMIDTAGQVADFCRARQAFSHKSEAIPQVALMLSSESFLDRSNVVFHPGTDYTALEGTLHALLESHYSVELMAEHTLLPKIQSYPVVVIAQAHKMAPATRTRLLEYVNAGGQLLLADRESAAHFHDVLGVTPIGKPEEVEAYVGTGGRTAAAPGLWQTIDPGASEPIAYRTGREGDATTGPIAAVRRKVGSGQITAAFGPTGDTFLASHHPHLRYWIKSLVAPMFPAPAVELTAPHDVDLSLRRLPDGRTAIHLVNNSGAQRANEIVAIDSVPHTGPITLKIRLEKNPAQLQWMPENTNLPWKRQGDHISAEIPDLHLHGAVVITP